MCSAIYQWRSYLGVVCSSVCPVLRTVSQMCVISHIALRDLRCNLNKPHLRFDQCFFTSFNSFLLFLVLFTGFLRAFFFLFLQPVWRLIMTSVLSFMFSRYRGWTHNVPRPSHRDCGSNLVQPLHAHKLSEADVNVGISKTDLVASSGEYSSPPLWTGLLLAIGR